MNLGNSVLGYLQQNSSETPEYIFCLARVLPYTADFEHYGWTSMTSHCIALQNQYTSSVHEMYFVQRDHLGSTVALTNSSGAVVQSYGYDVYGEPYVLSGNSYVAVRVFTGSLYGNNRLFTGREYESDLGLYYYRARFYSPELGRFISRDPIGMGDDVNLYAYVKNSPMMGVDPSGMVVKMMAILAYKGYSSYEDFKSHAKMEMLKGAFMGDFVEDPSIWNMIGQAGAGLIPVVGQAADARDLGAAGIQCKYGEDCASRTSLAGLSFVPVIGELRIFGRIAKTLKELKADKILKDFETILSNSNFRNTGVKFKGAVIHVDETTGNYLYRDSYHKGPESHLEMFSPEGTHLGGFDPFNLEKVKDASPKKYRIDDEIAEIKNIFGK